MAGILTLISGLGIQHFISKQSLFMDIIFRFKRFHRKDIWLGAWDSFLAEPFMGYGFHGLIQGYWENFPSQIDEKISWNDNAHSLILNVVGEMGIVSLIFLGLIHFYFIKTLIKKEKTDRAFWIGFGFFLFCYCFVQPFYIDTVLLFIFIGFIFKEKGTFSFTNRNKALISFQGMAIASLLVITFYQISQLKLINQTRRDIVSSKNYRKTWNAFMKTPGVLDKPGALLEISNQMGAAFVEDSVSLRRLQRPMILFMLDQYGKNFEQFSERPRMYENYANWLTRAGKYDEAIEILDKSLERSDRITKSVYQKASIYVKKKDYKKAKEMLLRVKELNPNFPHVDGYLLKLKNY
ncbi:MAG: tetratricopeptide (TPR) repeat protein [Bacteriovoracaceae bacterium]|jgi:tetratricopeptide (TPR) repeat protein